MRLMVEGIDPLRWPATSTWLYYYCRWDYAVRNGLPTAAFALDGAMRRMVA